MVRASWLTARVLADARTDDYSLRYRLGGLRGWIDPGLLGREPVEVALEPGRRADDQGPCVGAFSVIVCPFLLSQFTLGRRRDVLV
jgi:hypothetical protein